MDSPEIVRNNTEILLYTSSSLPQWSYFVKQVNISIKILTWISSPILSRFQIPQFYLLLCVYWLQLYLLNRLVYLPPQGRLELPCYSHGPLGPPIAISNPTHLLSFQKCYMNRILQYVTFGIGLFSCSITPWSHLDFKNSLGQRWPA